MIRNCIIIGGGVAGPATALALSKVGIQCSIYELRDTPATIGGAINLTPNALEILRDLGVEVPGCPVESIDLFSIYRNQKLGEIPFRKPGRQARRVLRKNLQDELLKAVDAAGIKVTYGSKLVAMVEDVENNKIRAKFSNGTSASAEFVIGCDGVHSAVRTIYVEPERAATYTGVASAYAFVPTSSIKSPVHFAATALNMSRSGSMLTSFHDQEKSSVYLAAVMQLPGQDSKESWKARGADKDSTLQEIHRRYRDSAFPCIPEMIDQVTEFVFYPVFALSAGGKWSRGNALLIGDAAHTMPPQGQSVGLALEDSILLSRVFDAFPKSPVQDMFRIYENTRRPRINKAWIAATRQWENVKDKPWWAFLLKEWFMWVYLWWARDSFEKSHDYDIRKTELVLA